eukprot:6932841-Prymnesium_polylepis.2
MRVGNQGEGRGWGWVLGSARAGHLSLCAPQSEAGIWTSVALSHALHVSAVGAAPVPISTAP